MTWKAGVDAVSFGGTKNGLMGVEAAVIFDPATAREFELRRKRGAHLFSKHRYLAAQMGAYLEGDLWLEMAAAANAACDRLARGLKQVEGARFHYEPQANIIFAEWSRAGHRRLHAAGAEYYPWNGSLDGGPEDEALTARLVTDWSATEAGIDRFVALARG
jgi:threonine aldolase